MSKIRLRVREVAQEKGINATTLSHKSYVALTTIRAIFQDPYKIVTTDTLQRLAEALEVSVFDLMEELPDDKSNNSQSS